MNEHTSASAFAPRRPNPLLRALGLGYALAAFAGTWVFFTWFVVFLANLPKRADPWVVPSIDVGGTADHPALALLFNVGLISLFCLQHSVMARPAFKRLIARLIPQALERATYVHAANVTGILLLLLWMPMPELLWSIEDETAKTAIWIAFGAGWLLLFLGAVSLDIFELLGLRQAWYWFSAQSHRPLALKTAFLYRYIEHPMYVGVLLGVWMTPHMSVGHALLASTFTIYIAIAMIYERRDLQARFGSAYLKWRTAPAEAVRRTRATTGRLGG